MFESIGIRRINHIDPMNPIDIGFIAESMIFYKKVKIIADTAILKKIVRDIEAEELIELLTLGYLEIEYVSNAPAIANSQNSFGEAKNLIFFQLNKNVEDILFDAIFDSTNRRGFAKRISNRIAPFIKTSSFDKQLGSEINQDFENSEYLTKSTKSILRDLVPNYKLNDQFLFVQHKTDNGLITETNLNFEEINKIYHQFIPPSHSKITDSYLLSHIANIRTEVHFATKYNTEIATDQIYSNVMKMLFNDIFDKFKNNGEKTNAFQEFVFKEGKDVRSAINNGQRSMKEVLDVIKQADKFKSWLGQIDNDKNLIQEYYNEVTKPSFIDKLPSKSIRWAFFTGAGLVLDNIATNGLGTIGSIALGASDTFILDKLIRKWKPNQFVDNELKQLVKGD